MTYYEWIARLHDDVPLDLLEWHTPADDSYTVEEKELTDLTLAEFKRLMERLA